MRAVAASWGRERRSTGYLRVALPRPHTGCRAAARFSNLIYTLLHSSEASPGAPASAAAVAWNRLVAGPHAQPAPFLQQRGAYEQLAVAQPLCKRPQAQATPPPEAPRQWATLERAGETLRHALRSRRP